MAGGTPRDKRFTNQIPWAACRNMSGQDISPFSVVTVQQWTMPDIAGSDISTDRPYAQIIQPVSPINPYMLFITDKGMISAGGWGKCARPDVYPQLASVSTFSSSGIAVGAMCGPTANNFNLTPNAPGFIVTAISSKQGYAFVQTVRGPYAGQLPQNTATTSPTVNVSTFVFPYNSQNPNPSSVTVTCANPYANIDTTQTGAVLRCTFDWVQSSNQWELIAADPCPPPSLS